MKNNLGIRGCVKDGTVFFQLCPQGSVIDEVTIVCDPNGTEPVTGNEGLNVLEHGLAGGGVTDVADGEATG